MARISLLIVAGVVLGIAVHIVIILSMPALAERNIWSRISALDNFEKITVLDDISPGSPNPLRLDPEIIYGICRLDLANGVGIINAQMPGDFWSVSVFDAQGTAVYGTTNRSIVGQTLKLGIFNDNQIKMLANQELDIEEGLLIVESNMNDIFVVLRAAPPYQAVRKRFRRKLAEAECASAR